MSGNKSSLIAITVLLATVVPVARASDVVRITIPGRSKLTPVQRLNRDGVEAVKRHDYEKASTLFYKAYLYDPADPFTLNNLGYVSEIQGELERAHKFYALAAEQGSNASIDRSSAPQLVGRPMEAALVNLEDNPMRVNRMNLDAMNLLAENRGFEAASLLEKALALDTRNPFTLNNLGVAEEGIGDFDSALRHYREAAASNSQESVVVTQDRSWRGKPVSRMAAESADHLEKRLNDMGTAQEQAIKYTIRGVAASNANDQAAAKDDFLKAYAIDSTSAFSLNNRGYIAEMEGDLESADYFYAKARRAPDAGAEIGAATRRPAEGQRLATIAADSGQLVDTELEKYSQERRRETAPIELTPRANQAPGQPQHQ
jgi:Flp pilus assembly protein TadD